jgi:hypothetical protein
MKSSVQFMIYLLVVVAIPSVSFSQQQQQPASSNTGAGTQPSNAWQTTPQTNPTTTAPADTTQQSVQTQPSAQPADPLGNTQQPPTTQPNNDYHLTQPSTSPVGSQIGTQNTNQSAATPQPYNQQPGEMMRVERSQLPGTMLEMLRDPVYQGWESSTIYYNRGTNEYSFDVGTGNEIKNYRFDRDGNPVQQQTPATIDDQR